MKENKNRVLKLKSCLDLAFRYVTTVQKGAKGFFGAGGNPYKGLGDLEQQLDFHWTRFPALL